MPSTSVDIQRLIRDLCKAMIPLSILDLSPVAEGSSVSDALRNTVDLARHAEQWGYARFWLAEHHNMPGIASSATSVVIGHVASQTRTIRVGSGGVMLPNHSPLVIAEQFGTLAALYPNRIDLGLGRAPGADRFTAHALRRDLNTSADDFPRDVVELQNYFRAAAPGQRLQATPGAGEEVPIWLLGSSLFGAELAAALGLPFAFASHFAPAMISEAVSVYRRNFQPSAKLKKSYLMLGVPVVAADTDEAARFQFTSPQQSFVNLRRGSPGKVPPPIDPSSADWSEGERAMIDDALGLALVGSAATVSRGLNAFAAQFQPDEVMISTHLFDHKARLRSFEILAGLRNAR
jgi:luciferase family oxidoreductase group 1